MGLGIPTVHSNDWVAVRKGFQRINSVLLGPDATPIFASITLGDLSASRLVWTDASKALVSKDLIDLVAGTAKRVLVSDDSAGGIILTGPQDLDTVDSPTLGGLNLLVFGASDATQSFITADHQIDIYVDQSTANDTLVIEGQTAAKVTNLYLVAKDGYNSVLALYSGANKSLVYKAGSDDALVLSNITQDADIVFSIDDGGVTKTIRWDADVDKLKHSAGLFDFDNDNIVTIGTFDGSAGKVLVTDNDVSEPTGESDGYIGVSEITSRGRIYIFVNGTRYHFVSEAPEADPGAGMPIGIFPLTVTYAT